MFNNTTKYLFAWLGLTLVLAVLVTTAQDVPSKPCNLQFKCSSEGPGVWATDGNQCFVFPNACQLANENCQRQNRFEAELEVVSRKECQKLCGNVQCLQVYQPLCAVYNGTYRTFSNSCDMGNYICRTAEFYTFAYEGQCESANPETDGCSQRIYVKER